MTRRGIGRPGSGRRWGPVSRRGRWRRSQALRAAAALLFGTAVWLVAAPLLPHPSVAATPVVVAARALALGETLTSADLRTEEMTADEVPPGALREVAAGVGQVTSGPVLVGEVVTTARFRGPSQLAGMPSGHVAVSVPVLDAALLGSLRPADEVSLLVSGSGDIVAPRALVLAVQQASTGLLGQTGVSNDHLVLAVTADEARAVAAAMGAASPTTFLIALRS